MAPTAVRGVAAPRSVPWQVRAGWLLRAHRTRHSDPALRGLGGFARAFGEGHGAAGAVSPSSVSRWETGRTPVPRAAVRRYEQVLGLVPYQLVAVVETIARYEGGPAAEAFARGGVPEPGRGGPADHRIDLLLDRVLDGDVLSGDDWDELTLRATRAGRLVSPGRTRHAVCGRLLAETLVADGVAWMRRFEALGRLLADPVWAPQAAEACREVAGQAEHAGLIEATCALDNSAHPDAARYVLRQLTAPTHADSFYGALLASVRKCRKRHFAPEQTRIVAEVVAAVLTGGTARQEDAEVAANLLRLLPMPAARAVRLAEAAGNWPTTRSIVAYGSLVDPGSADVGVAHVLLRTPGADGPAAESGVLSDIVDDVLHHPVADVRLYAAMLLNASPYGPGVAAALADELRLAGTVQSAERAVPMLHALRVLGGPEQRPVVAGLTLAQGVPNSVVSAAVHAIGHIGGRSPEPYWRAVLRRHVEHRDARPGAATDAELKRLVYGFAMGGELDLLTRLVDEHARASSLQGMSAWWTGLSHHIRDSAARR